MQEIFDRVREELKSMFQFQSGDHDYYHLERVFNLGQHLQEKEGGDSLVIGVSALTHDVHHLIKRETGKYCLPKDSIDRIKVILSNIGLSDEQKQSVYRCVELHEEYDFSPGGKFAKDIETLILQDADNLDAIGAIGIARTFTYGGANGLPLWIPELHHYREQFHDSQNDPTTIHHFYSKLLRLKDNMNTGTAREMAEYRHQVMVGFLDEFFREWKGEA